MDMGSLLHQFLQQLINGISLGSIYALIALGYTMIYGILKLINFAHGDIYMLGAYFGFVATTMFGFGRVFWVCSYNNVWLFLFAGNSFCHGLCSRCRYYH